MRLMPDAKKGRALAVILLLIVLLLGYLVGVHWWFVSPLVQSRQEMIELRDEEARFRAIAQQRDAIREALTQVRQFESENPGFLTEANFDLAASALIQRLQEQIDMLQAGESCKLISRTPFRGNQNARAAASASEPFEKVTIKVRMFCEMEYFGPLLHGLESGSPQLFVSDLTITSRRGSGAATRSTRPGQRSQAAASTLDQSFDLYGYLRRSPGGKS
ncbi:type II secretion system protein GspM [Xanthomonadaceae bacterium JHOS43]|nr:type II secretion system protein GspM [Xanthomonadaceae bacterium JHOS43]